MSSKDNEHNDGDSKEASDIRGLDDRELVNLVRHGRAFQNFMRAAREIEKIYLTSDRKPNEVRAAAASIRRALDDAMWSVGGCAIGKGPVPLRLIFGGLVDVEYGTYARLLSPPQHKFGDQYESHNRRMIISHALAVWDLAVKYGEKSSSAEKMVVTALNRAGFRIPKVPAREGKTTGEVTETALEQWRKRARSDKAPYSESYFRARKNLDQMLSRIGAENKAGLAQALIQYLERFAEAHRIAD